MEEGGFSILSILFIAVMITPLLPHAALGDPRSQMVDLNCSIQAPPDRNVSLLNFVALMETIRTQIQTQSYAVASTGEETGSVYGLFQCYGDLPLVDCGLCYSEARTKVPSCYPSSGAILFLDGCFMRTEDYSFFEEYTGPQDRAICSNTTTKNLAFQETARQAVLQAVSFAPNNNGYARVEMPISGTSNESAYVLANCWRTLNNISCRACLQNASTSILRCLPWSESRALNTGCFMRYSDANFLNPISSNNSSRGTPTVIIAVVVSSTVVVTGAAVLGAYIWKHRRIEKKRKGSYDPKKLAKLLRDTSLYFEYSILERATDGFHEANKLGQGGFGTVYKGVLSDGREIAVKRLFFNNIHRAKQFFNEINIISSLVHTNLVKLLGCSCSGTENFLVYEFLQNKSLDRFIFDANEGKALNWEKRFVIIIAIAEGLVYLHNNPNIRIIHRDIKASNILLDARLRAKIADFGLARSFQEDKSHINTPIAGTFGYMAPEYLVHGILTEKADVYSFGVLLLEIVTGRQQIGTKTLEEYSKGLVTAVWVHFQQGVVQELIDPNLMLQNYHTISMTNEVLRVVHVGLLCTQEVSTLRPSMLKALQLLTKKDELLPSPSNPPFVDEKSTYPPTFCNSNSIATVSQGAFNPR